MKERSEGAVNDPAFLIVGTPRSGSTLLQRIVCEAPGVAVPPETGFWPMLGTPVLRRNEMPLAEARLRQVLEQYQRRRITQGLALDVDQIVYALGGSCERLASLFSAIVRRLVPDALISGEKTPQHILWWRPLSRALPHLKFIPIVRDPRAVVASSRHVPFMPTSDALVAERWAQEQRQVLAAKSELGRERLLVVRYEDLVAEPEITRACILRFLGTRASDGFERQTPGQIFHPREWWKELALGPIVAGRAQAWRHELTESDEMLIGALCLDEMQSFGYQNEVAPRRTTLGPRSLWRLARFRKHFGTRQEWIDGLVL